MFPIYGKVYCLSRAVQKKCIGCLSLSSQAAKGDGSAAISPGKGNPEMEVSVPVSSRFPPDPVSPVTPRTSAPPPPASRRQRLNQRCARAGYGSLPEIFCLSYVA